MKIEKSIHGNSIWYVIAATGEVLGAYTNYTLALARMQEGA